MSCISGVSAYASCYAVGSVRESDAARVGKRGRFLGIVTRERVRVDRVARTRGCQHTAISPAQVKRESLARLYALSVLNSHSDALGLGRRRERGNGDAADDDTRNSRGRGDDDVTHGGFLSFGLCCVLRALVVYDNLHL